MEEFVEGKAAACGLGIGGVADRTDHDNDHMSGDFEEFFDAALVKTLHGAGA